MSFASGVSADAGLWGFPRYHVGHCLSGGAVRVRGAPWRWHYFIGIFNAAWAYFLLYIAFVVYFAFASGGIPQGWTHAAWPSLGPRPSLGPPWARDAGGIASLLGSHYITGMFLTLSPLYHVYSFNTAIGLSHGRHRTPVRARPQRGVSTSGVSPDVFTHRFVQLVASRACVSLASVAARAAASPCLGGILRLRFSLSNFK